MERLHPDVLVLDLMMPHLGGLEVLRRVASSSPRTRVVALSMHSDEAYVAEALRGRSRRLCPEGLRGRGIAARRPRSRCRTPFSSPAISEKSIHTYIQKTGSDADPFAGLTDREREVLQLTAEGHSGTAIVRRTLARAQWRATVRA